MNFFSFPTNRLLNEEIITPFTHEETVALLNVWGTPEIQQMFDSLNYREVVWKNVARQMSVVGYNRPWSQYKEHIDLLIEEFYYINSAECSVPNEIKKNWVYKDYLQPWLQNNTFYSSIELEINNKKRAVKSLLKDYDGNQNMLSVYTITDADNFNGVVMKHLISHQDMIKARIMKHVRFSEDVDESPARKEEFFNLGGSNRRKCCNIF